MQYGNNIEAAKSFRLKIPLFNNTSTLISGQKYFFPDTPIFNGKNIVGIDANLKTNVAGTQFGDLKAPDNNNLGELIDMTEAQNLYCTIYDKDYSEKFASVPLRSFFMVPSVTNPGGIVGKRIVKPYYGSINPAKSYFFLAVGALAIKTKKYISLTFYYT